MNKGDLVKAVSSASEITNAQASKAVETVFNSIQDALKSGDKAAFVGFGTFSTSERKAREGRNPSTGETIQIPAKTQIKFKAGKAFDEAVNNK